MPEPQPMRLSVIIPTWYEAANVARAVASAQAAGADEVLVVDGGSQDATCAQAAAAGAVVRHTLPGRARQMNAGAAAAHGECLVFLHADNWLDPAACEHVRAALHHDVQCGALHQRIDAPERRYRWLERGNAARVRWFGLAYGDQAIFVTRALFERVGGFPNVRFLEDFIFMRTVRRHTRPVLVPGLVHVSPRRWQEHGVVRQTARNWLLIAAYGVGVAPDRLARFYRKPGTSPTTTMPPPSPDATRRV